jgi:hypothetical protein
MHAGAASGDGDRPEAVRRLLQLRTKESDIRRDAGQQPLEEMHDRENFAFRRAGSSGYPQRLTSQVTVVG